MAGKYKYTAELKQSCSDCIYVETCLDTDKQLHENTSGNCSLFVSLDEDTSLEEEI